MGIILGTIFLSRPLGILGPAIGVVLGALLHLLVQLPLAKTLGFVYKPFIRTHPALSEMLHLMLPRTVTLSLVQLEATAIIAFASHLSSGTVTVMTIAQQLANLPIRLIGVTIGQASLPFFAKETARHDLTALATTVNNSILQMLYLALPASAIILVLRIPLVRLAYGASSFPWSETVTTGKLVAILALSITARSLTHVVIRVFYALHDTITPFLVNLISTMLNLFLSYYLLFVVHTGVVGMAFAITIASLLETLVLTSLLYALAHFSWRHLVLPVLKMFTASGLTALCLWGPMRLLDQYLFDTTHTLPLIFLTIIVTIIGLCVYLCLSSLLQIHELAAYTSLLHKIGNWKNILGQTDTTLENSETSV